MLNELIGCKIVGFNGNYIILEYPDGKQTGLSSDSHGMKHIQIPANHKKGKLK